MLFALIAVFFSGSACAQSSPSAMHSMRSPPPLVTAAPTPAIMAEWLGAAGISLSDGTTTLLFDPVFTKPSILNWVFNTRFKSDKNEVRKGLSQSGIKRAEAIFTSHTHFDHAVDAAAVARETGATLYGGPSLKRIVDKGALPVTYKLVQDQEVIQVGDFKITMIKRDPEPVLPALHWSFLDGEVRSDFDFEFYQYRAGEVWGFYVEHPRARILIDQGSHFFPANARYRNKVDVYFVGVSNKDSMDDLVQNNIEQIGARRVIPLHFDVFFLQWSWLERQRLPGANLETLQSRVSGLFIPDRYWPIPLP